MLEQLRKVLASKMQGATKGRSPKHLPPQALYVKDYPKEKSHLAVLQDGI